MQRSSWDEVWWAVAQTVSSRARCVRRQVGAVIVGADNRVAATGYNGPPAGYPVPDGAACTEVCPQAITLGNSWCIAAHAEINALLHCDRSAREGGTIYVTAFPCLKCAVAIANSGIGRVVAPIYEPARRDEGFETLSLLSRSGLDWRRA